MSTNIQDGTGTKTKLRITGENRALVQAVIITEEDNAIIELSVMFPSLR